MVGTTHALPLQDFIRNRQQFGIHAGAVLPQGPPCYAAQGIAVPKRKGGFAAGIKHI